MLLYIRHMLLLKDRKLLPLKKSTGQIWGSVAAWRGAVMCDDQEVHILRTNTAAMTDLQIPAIVLFHGAILKAEGASCTRGPGRVRVKSHLDCLRFTSATFSSSLSLSHCSLLLLLPPSSPYFDDPVFYVVIYVREMSSAHFAMYVKIWNILYEVYKDTIYTVEWRNYIWRNYKSSHFFLDIYVMIYFFK